MHTLNGSRSFLWLLFLWAPLINGQVDLLRSDESGIVAHIKLAGIGIQEIPGRKGPLSQIIAPDLNFESKPGEVDIPFLRFHVQVPLGHSVRVGVLSHRKEKEIKLTTRLAYVDRERNHCRPKKVPMVSRIYEQVYGENWLEVEEVGYVGADRIATIRFNPIYYDPTRNILRLTSEAQVALSFIPEKLSQPAVIKSGGSSIRGLVINPPPMQKGVNPKIDLILTHPDYLEALTEYIHFKRWRGRTVKVLSVSDKKKDEIKALIKTEYASNPAPNNTLLVGSISQIPAWSGSGDNRWTDYPYTTLDGDAIPDISLGRLPVQSVGELTVFLKKAMAREEKPQNLTEILLTAGKDTSLGCPANVTKVGTKIQEAGSDIRITKKYRTEVGTQEVLDGYNANPNIIVYDGHGNRSGMTEIPLLMSGMSQLKNNVFPIVLDIACLNANWGSTPASRNFAETILLTPDAGLAGIMASGGSGNGHEFFQTIGSLMANARKNLANDTMLNEIGRVIMLAKAKHGSQDRSYWNYYGDPASSIWDSTVVESP